jgi:hypothetical protein
MDGMEGDAIDLFFFDPMGMGRAAAGDRRPAGLGFCRLPGDPHPVLPARRRGAHARAAADADSSVYCGAVWPYGGCWGARVGRE